jgi:hypothetical protein
MRFCQSRHTPRYDSSVSGRVAPEVGMLWQRGRAYARDLRERGFAASDADLPVGRSRRCCLSASPMFPRVSVAAARPARPPPGRSVATAAQADRAIRRHPCAGRRPSGRDPQRAAGLVAGNPPGDRDETWTTTNMVRLYGCSPQGTRLIDRSPYSHWKTSTFIAGLREDGLVASAVFDRPSMPRCLWPMSSRSWWTTCPRTRRPLCVGPLRPLAPR